MASSMSKGRFRGAGLWLVGSFVIKALSIVRVRPNLAVLEGKEARNRTGTGLSTSHAPQSSRTATRSPRPLARQVGAQAIARPTRGAREGEPVASAGSPA